MRQSIACGLTLLLLAGCATFETSNIASRSDILERDTTPVSLQQMRLLQVGEWYAVRLPEKEGRSGVKRGVYYSGYVGRLQSSDDDSLTLTDVVKCTNFGSRSSLRYLPIVGSNFGDGWGGCDNVPGNVSIPRSEIMWFEPISAREADKFQHYREIVEKSFCLEANTESDDPRAQFGDMIGSLPDESFVLPNPKSEETRVQRWLEVRQVKVGEWYSVSPAPEQRYVAHRPKIHVGIVDHVDEDRIYFKNVTTVFLPNTVGSESVGEMILKYSEIDRVIPLTPEQAERQIELFNHPRELPDANDDE